MDHADKDNSRKREAIRSLQQAAAVLNHIHCLPAADGNFSVRLNGGSILITKSGIEKRALSDDSFIELRFDQTQRREASTEWPLHRQIYLHRPEVGCVLHVHAPFLTAFAAAHRIPDAAILTEAVAVIGEMALIPFAVPGTDKLGGNLIYTAPRAMLYLLTNHGAVAVGESVEDALHRLERAEFLAATEYRSMSLGGPKPLTETQLTELRKSMQQ